MITTINNISELISSKTENFTNSKIGKIFLSLVLLGPLTFIPTMYEAWTAPDIDALRTWTWPLMVMINTSGLYGNIRNGDWRLRLVMLAWVLVMAIMSLAILIR